MASEQHIPVADEAVLAAPLYVQERIDPATLIEDLRRDGDFDSAGADSELVAAYRHRGNWSNRMILGDSLQVMASLVDRDRLRGQVQMVYLDPPDDLRFGSNWQASTREREVKDGKHAHITREVEQLKVFRDTWGSGIGSYLSYLGDRLIAARDLLAASGSCFVQVSEQHAHLVRSLMDEVFGAENFMAQISVAIAEGFVTASGLAGAADFILWFARDADRVKTRTLWRHGNGQSGYGWLMLEDGSSRLLTAAEREDPRSVPAGARIYRAESLRSPGAASSDQPFVHRGKTYRPGNRFHWRAGYPSGMERLALAGRIHVGSSTLEYVRYSSDLDWQKFNNVWTDTRGGGFADGKLFTTQASAKVVGRCMLLCTDPGDLVLDPSGGAGTTAFVAERWGRRWITIDSSRVALAIARQRLMAAKYPFYLLADSAAGRAIESSLTTVAPASAPAGDDVGAGFVLQRFRRVTLASIVNNPDIVAGMSQPEIDAAIDAHARSELLYDRPYEDAKTVRVTGPFTVESLSPHRSLDFTGHGGGAGFERSVLDNLATVGIDNGNAAEHIDFLAVENYAGSYIQAIGDRDTDALGPATPSRIGIAIGPQYGAVTASFIRAAAREAIQSQDTDLLCVLGFAFDPQAFAVTEVDGVTTEVGFRGFDSIASQGDLGPIGIQLVRMNPDLVMGERLKKAAPGTLFAVFGEPDIGIRRVGGDQLVVDLLGVDVYDPSTGEVRSAETGNIALWMIDTDYSGDPFFARHCYFNGGKDPFKRLRRALKADIDTDAWSALYSSVSRPFPRPSSGQIAVKVINDNGDEVMKIVAV